MPKRNPGAAKSAEHRQKLSDVARALWADPVKRQRMLDGLAKRNLSGPNNPMYGVKRPWLADVGRKAIAARTVEQIAATRAACSAATKGKKQSADFIAKRTRNMRGKSKSAAHKAKLSAAAIRRFQRPEQKAKIIQHLTSLSKCDSPTKPEIHVKMVLRELGLLFSAQSRLEGFGLHNFDFIVPDRKLAIEVDGCYWHGCQSCGYGDQNLDKQARDRILAALIRKSDWKLLRIWEHDLIWAKEMILGSL